MIGLSSTMNVRSYADASNDPRARGAGVDWETGSFINMACDGECAGTSRPSVMG
jgi:hypothetical protein